jgi:hypothetical protein
VLAQLQLPVFQHSCLQPLVDQAKHTRIPDAVPEKSLQPRPAQSIEEAGNIRIDDPVHLGPDDRGGQCIQRIVLAAARPESVTEAHEVCLVDRIEHLHQRTLQDLVLQRRDREWPLAAIALVDVRAS